MRSIRRSLIGYFLVLTLVALSAMGIFIDQYTRTMLEDRRDHEFAQVNSQFESRRQDEFEKLDQDLLDRAFWVAVAMQSNTFTLQFDQDRHEFSKLTISFGLAGPFQAATIPALIYRAPNRFNPLPNRIATQFQQEYFAKLKLNSSFLHNIGNQDQFQDLFQVQLSPSQTWQSTTLADLKLPFFSQSDFDTTSFIPKHDEYTFPDGTVVRRVVQAFPGFGRVPVFGFGGPGGPGGPGGRGGGRGGRPGGDRPPTQQQPPSPPGAETPRFFVQVARPIETLHPKLTEFENARKERLSEIDATTSNEQTGIRLKLIGIISAAVIAMLLGSLILTRRGLVPLDRLTSAVSRVTEKDFQLPIQADELSTELAPVHARLTDTLDALRRAFEREKQAVADISHELRTPIAALGVTLDVALKKTRTPEQYRLTLSECRAINAQLGKLVERIMTLATLDAGQARTASVKVDAADLAAGCASVIKPLAEAYGVTLSTSIARPLPVVTDPDKLREVLINLLHNAVEYNRPGGIIELSATGGNGHGVTFGVRDTGIGMTPEIRERIFERFYRADPSRTATGVHAGLGLAIVKEYVSRLGGTISVDSSPNVGSTFRVSLPPGSNCAA